MSVWGGGDLIHLSKQQNVSQTWKWKDLGGKQLLCVANSFLCGIAWRVIFYDLRMGGFYGVSFPSGGNFHGARISWGGEFNFRKRFLWSEGLMGGCSHNVRFFGRFRLSWG